MSRIIAVTLLLIILVDNFYDTTAADAIFRVSKVHIRKCRCKVLGKSGKMMCPFPLIPQTRAEEQDLIKCFCSKVKKQEFPEFQAFCRTPLSGPPL